MQVNTGQAPAPGRPGRRRAGKQRGWPAGPITDGGWHQFAYEGSQRLKGFDVAFTENIKQADIPAIPASMPMTATNSIIGHGF
ncbi:MAG: hypothetical protein U0401_27865 [Anaerolineae bacterium]